MTARLIVFDLDGNKVTHSLSLHQRTAGIFKLKLVLGTSTEHIEPWLFFFLRDHGAYIETTNPDAVAAALNLRPGEPGIIQVRG